AHVAQVDDSHAVGAQPVANDLVVGVAASVPQWQQPAPAGSSAYEATTSRPHAMARRQSANMAAWRFMLSSMRFGRGVASGGRAGAPTHDGHAPGQRGAGGSNPLAPDRGAH